MEKQGIVIQSPILAKKLLFRKLILDLCYLFFTHCFLEKAHTVYTLPSIASDATAYHRTSGIPDLNVIRKMNPFAGKSSQQLLLAFIRIAGIG